MKLKNLRHRLLFTGKFLILFAIVAIISYLTIQTTSAVQKWLRVEAMANHAEKIDSDLVLQEAELKRLKWLEYSANEKKIYHKTQMEEWEAKEKKYTENVRNYAKNTIEKTLCEQAISRAEFAVINNDQITQSTMIEKANKFCDKEKIPTFLKRKDTVKVETVYVETNSWAEDIIEDFDEAFEQYGY